MRTASLVTSWRRLWWGALLAGVVLLPGGTPAGAVELRPSTATRFVLDNGLVVLVEEDHAYPRVALEVRVRGGSCDDLPWVGSGQAHLMEHMLFKGTERRAVGTIEPEVRRYEGNFNAFTSYDYTGYSLAVSSRHTRDALDLLADVLFHSSFDPAELTKEQEVVRSEMRMNRDDPQRRLHWAFWGAAFQVHPYRHPVIGYQEVFDRLSRDEVLAFYRARYVPNNMVLAIVGDVHAPQVRQWLEEFFGGASRGVPFDWDRAVESPQLTPRQVTDYFPVQQAQLLLGFHSTRLQDDDLYPLDVLAQILGGGESARLERRLRRELGLVHAVSAWNSTPQDPGLFIINATVDADKVDRTAEAVREELRLIGRTGVTAEELARAKQMVLAGYLQARQTLAARAGDLATNELLVGDYDFSRRYVDGIQRVANEDIRRAVQRHVRDEAWTQAALVPPPAEAVAAEPVTAPEYPAFAWTQKTLKNGIRVVVGEDHRVPLVALRAMWSGGLRAEQPETAGLSQLTAQLLLGGTATHTAEQLVGMVENRGGRISTFSGKDAFGVSLDLLAQDASFGVELLHELMTTSVFPGEEVERERSRMLAALRARQDDIFQVTGDRVRELLLGEHPYARHPLGTRASVETLAPKDCQQFFRQYVVPERLVLVVHGDVDPRQVMALLERQLSDIPQGLPGEMDARMVEMREEPEQAFLELPAREQAVVTVGYPGVAWSHSDRYALELIQAVLSGSGGRLYQRIRERTGSSYTLGAAHVAGEVGGYQFGYVATSPERAEQVGQALQEELAALVKEPPPVEELELAKRTLRDGYYESMQDMGDVAFRTALNVLMGLGTEELSRYPEQLARLSRQDVARVLRAYLGSSSYVEVVTRPPAALQPTAQEVAPQ